MSWGLIHSAIVSDIPLLINPIVEEENIINQEEETSEEKNNWQLRMNPLDSNIYSKKANLHDSTPKESYQTFRIVFLINMKSLWDILYSNYRHIIQ